MSPQDEGWLAEIRARWTQNAIGKWPHPVMAGGWHARADVPRLLAELDRLSARTLADDGGPRACDSCAGKGSIYDRRGVNDWDVYHCDDCNGTGLAAAPPAAPSEEVCCADGAPPMDEGDEHLCRLTGEFGPVTYRRLR